MHIELTEMLQCPAPHPPEGLVLSTGTMRGRRVVSGLVGCPACRREYPLVDGVVLFGESPSAPAEAPAPDPVALQALLDVDGPGGFIVLVGAAVRDATELAARLDGVHFVGVNPPSGVRESPVLSLLRAPASIPLRARIARGVILGAEAGDPPWLSEAERVLLPGRRLVIEREAPEAPSGVRRLAAGDGLWVGEKA
ncbi:MAG TPA: hypothetical protein VN848_08840 [Gemmatimonadales bacterium]|nr:hypothetical protein [Gemmatimonadales bacterium]